MRAVDELARMQRDRDRARSPKVRERAVEETAEIVERVWHSLQRRMPPREQIVIFTARRTGKSIFQQVLRDIAALQPKKPAPEMRVWIDESRMMNVNPEPAQPGYEESGRKLYERHARIYSNMNVEIDAWADLDETDRRAWAGLAESIRTERV